MGLVFGLLYFSRFLTAASEVFNGCFVCKSLYARVDSNHWPLVPETNALSGLSYGRAPWL
jgi:hypothetical protein